MSRRFAGTTHRLTSATFGGVASAGSIGFWLRPNWSSGDSAKHVFFINADDNLTSGPGFQKFSDNQIYCGFEGGGFGDDRIIVSDSGLFSAGVWAYWLFTWTSAAGGSCSLYRNNVLVGSRSPVTPFVRTALTVGNYFTPAENCDADMAELAYWPAVLTAADRALLLNGAYANSPLLSAAPTNYWRLVGDASPEPDFADSKNLTVTGPTTAPAPPPWTGVPAPPTASGPTRLWDPSSRVRWYPPLFYAPAPPPPAGQPTYAPAFARGPVRSGPFGLSTRPFAPPPASPPAPVVAPTPTYAPPLRGGPPIPGAPWRLSRAPTFPRAQYRTTPPTSTAGNATGLEFFERVNEAVSNDGRERLRRFTERVSNLLNSLVAKGILVKTGPATWTISTTATSSGGGLTGTFP